MIESQEIGKEVCNKIVHWNLSKTDVLKKLKPRNCTGEAKNATTTNAIARKEELDYADASNTEYRFSNFAIRQKTIFILVA